MDSSYDARLFNLSSKEEEWKEISQSFENKWNFPHVIGTLDGKHIVMQAPHNAGSGYFNYKKTHSMVLLAICNANYEFILVDIRDFGRQSDGFVYANSHLGFCIENKNWVFQLVMRLIARV